MYLESITMELPNEDGHFPLGLFTDFLIAKSIVILSPRIINGDSSLEALVTFTV